MRHSVCLQQNRELSDPIIPRVGAVNKPAEYPVQCTGPARKDVECVEPVLFIALLLLTPRARGRDFINWSQYLNVQVPVPGGFSWV